MKKHYYFTLWIGLFIVIKAGSGISQETYDLPLFIIETPLQRPIPKDPKITAKLKVIDSPEKEHTTESPANVYDGFIGIETRGNFSESLPQKPFSFETRMEDGENRNVPFFHLPEENDWILLANYNDKVFMRNVLTYHLFREMGHYAPRTKYVEVILNNSYQGIYILTEKIKRDKNRVNISKLKAEDNEGDQLTGGYIFKNDYFDWTGEEGDHWIGSFSPETLPDKEVPFVYNDPKPSEITEAQKQYLQEYVLGFESTLFGEKFNDPVTGFRAYIAEHSFIDYLIISELSRNVDAYKKSKYYFKDRDSKGGNLHSGPVWDYDWAYKNIEGGGASGEGWAHISEPYMWPTPNGWIERMLKDERFYNQVGNRYHDLRSNILSEEYLFMFIDEQYEILKEAQKRHYQKWPILGINVGAPEGGDWQPDTYEGEIEKFKNWLTRRLIWLDANMPSAEASNVEEEIDDELSLRYFPNPSSDHLYIESEISLETIEVFSSNGSMVNVEIRQGGSSFRKRVDLQKLPTGLYLFKVQFTTGKTEVLKISKI